MAPRRWKTCWPSWSRSHTVARHQQSLSFRVLLFPLPRRSLLMFFLHGSACPSHSHRLISSGHGGHGVGQQEQGRGRAGARQGRPGQSRAFFFSFSHMIRNHKSRTLTYYTLSEVIISYDKHVAVYQIFTFFFPFFLFILSWGWPFLLWGLALP